MRKNVNDNSKKESAGSSSGIYKRFLKRKYGSKRGRIVCCWLVDKKHNDNNNNRQKRELLNKPICLCLDRTKRFINGGTIFPDKKKDCPECFWRDRQLNQYASDDMGKMRRCK